MPKINFILIVLALTLNVCVAQSKWTWPNGNTHEKQRDYYPYARADREREPTTKRPLPGQPENDDIDDYNDANEEASKQNSPYLPPGVIAHPLIAGNLNGFGNYPQPQLTGSAQNGILVGPGGPTGIIGRPPGAFAGGVAPSAFPGYHGQQHFPVVASTNNPVFTNYNGLNNILGQYPYANVNNIPQQLPAAQYPQAQFSGAQYPHQTPQYTEGYGLANFHNGFNLNPHFNGNFNPNYGFGFDAYNEQAEGKSANVKSINRTVDDKVAKNPKKI